tara:strand:+ start:657 stop:1592 length:936 start_codon:yes stop_codon:yes gene_type:complete
MSRLFCLLMMTTTPAFADAPKVVTDIAPVHALVAQVMDGVGTPDLIIPANASPHGYAMRPSEARNLAQAELVIWVGPTLTPWLDGPVETLGGGATQLILADVNGLTVLPFREGEAFESHDHDPDHAQDGDHSNDHDGRKAIDPHLWLDPDNASIWLSAIATALASADPENADTYHDNASRGQVAIAIQEKVIATQLEPFADTPFIVLHDGFHYFESHFGVIAIAAVSAGDAATPGAAHIASLRAHLKGSGVRCAFAEPQINASLLDTVTEGLDVRVGILDPLGANLPQGPGQYAALLGAMADSMAECLSHE